MCLERAFSGYLAYFFEVGLRPRALSVERKERGSVLSTLEIEPRTPTVKLNCINFHPRFSESELKNKCGQFSGASNEPIFAAIGTRGAAPRLLQCAIDDECTLNCTFLRFFIQKLCRYWADRASEGRLASNRMQGDKMRVFSRMCARFWGWFPRRFFARTRFLEVCATTFSAHRAGICPHMAGQLIGTRGTKRAQKIRAPRPGT